MSRWHTPVTTDHEKPHMPHTPQAPDTLVTITLPDQQQLQLASPTSVANVAAAIGPGLARRTLAGRVNGEWVDACDPIIWHPTTNN